jgi:hypothetical protein
LVAKGLSADPGALRRPRNDRDINAAQPGDVLAKAGHEPQQIGPGLKQKDGGRQEIAARESGLADLLVQLLR